MSRCSVNLMPRVDCNAVQSKAAETYAYTIARHDYSKSYGDITPSDAYVLIISIMSVLAGFFHGSTVDGGPGWEWTPVLITLAIGMIARAFWESFKSYGKEYCVGVTYRDAHEIYNGLLPENKEIALPIITTMYKLNNVDERVKRDAVLRKIKTHDLDMRHRLVVESVDGSDIEAAEARMQGWNELYNPPALPSPQPVPQVAPGPVSKRRRGILTL